MRKITGGTSKTLFIGEIIGTDAVTDIRGAWTSNGMGAAGFTAYNPPNSGPAPPKQHPLYPDHTVEFGDRIDGLAANAMIPYVRLQGSAVKSPGDQWATARSMHPGGVLAIHVDGSTRFYLNDTDLVVWQQLASRAGESGK